MLLHYHKEIEKFHTSYSEIPIALVDNGKFLSELTRLNNLARQKTIDAKIAEAKAFPNKENSYTAYQQAILAYDNVLEYINANANGLASVTQYTEKRNIAHDKRENRRSWRFAIISAILGVILGYIINFLG